MSFDNLSGAATSDVPAAHCGTRIVESPPGVVTVVVSGELDMATCRRMDRTVREALAARPWRLTIDLTAVTFCGSAGLRALFVLHGVADEAGTRLTVRPSAAIDRLLKITGLDALPIVAPEPTPERIPRQR